MEVWKDVVGYEGIYQISNYGTLKSLDRLDRKGRITHGKIISTKKNNRQYIQVHLLKDGKEKMALLHRLVAQAFIPNPNNYAQVNHKDENKDNNNANNLEWCTNIYNRRYGTGYQRSVEKHDYKKLAKLNSKRVIQLDSEENILNIFNSIREAQDKTNVHRSNISACCKKGNRIAAGGYKWRYAEDEICKNRFTEES